MKFSKPFYAVPDGEIYPKWYQPGEECPKSLESAAKETGVLEDKPVAKRATSKE